MLAGILKNELGESHVKWEKACLSQNIDYSIIDLTKADWFNMVNNEEISFFLLRPPGEIQKFKDLYDERVYIISEILHKTVFPSYREILLHENKKLLSYFLKSKQLPCPATDIYYFKQEALDNLGKYDFPVVVKTTIGASGSGVTIIRNTSELKRYIGKAFKRGIKRRFGPNRNTGNPKMWIVKLFNDFPKAIKKIKKYFTIYGDTQKGYVIIQKYIPHRFEWRVVKIGQSFFAHKKVKVGDKASGTKGIDYTNPPLSLLDFVRDLCELNNFNFMTVDLFEDPSGEGFLINELQTIFGHVQDYLMEVDGIKGRYVFTKGKWIFEEGDFNSNESYDLRLIEALKIYENRK